MFRIYISIGILLKVLPLKSRNLWFILGINQTPGYTDITIVRVLWSEVNYLRRTSLPPLNTHFIYKIFYFV